MNTPQNTLLHHLRSAALPPLLAAATVRAGLASAMGNTVSGMVSAQVVALAEGGVGSRLAKKASITLILLASLTLGLRGSLAYRTVHSPTLAEAPAGPKTAPAAASPPARSASKGQAIKNVVPRNDLHGPAMESSHAAHNDEP